MWTRVGRYHGNSIIICVGNNRTVASSTLSVYWKLDNRACAVLDGRGTNARVHEWLQGMATSPTKLNLVAKKNAKSVVWQYFDLETDEKNILKQELEDQPVCRKYYKQVWVNHGNTSNLLSHLRDNHPNECAEASKFVHFGVQMSIPQYRNTEMIVTTIIEQAKVHYCPTLMWTMPYILLKLPWSGRDSVDSLT